MIELISEEISSKDTQLSQVNINLKSITDRLEIITDALKAQHKINADVLNALEYMATKIPTADGYSWDQDHKFTVLGKVQSILTDNTGRFVQLFNIKNPIILDTMLVPSKEKLSDYILVPLNQNLKSTATDIGLRTTSNGWAVKTKNLQYQNLWHMMTRGQPKEHSVIRNKRSKCNEYIDDNELVNTTTEFTYVKFDPNSIKSVNLTDQIINMQNELFNCTMNATIINEEAVDVGLSVYKSMMINLRKELMDSKMTSDDLQDQLKLLSSIVTKDALSKPNFNVEDVLGDITKLEKTATPMPYVDDKKDTDVSTGNLCGDGYVYSFESSQCEFIGYT